MQANVLISLGNVWFDWPPNKFVCALRLKALDKNSLGGEVQCLPNRAGGRVLVCQLCTGEHAECTFFRTAQLFVDTNLKPRGNGKHVRPETHSSLHLSTETAPSDVCALEFCSPNIYFDRVGGDMWLVLKN